LVAGQATGHSSVWRWVIVIGGGVLLLAVGIIIGLMTRSRHESSLITLSMHAHPNRPPAENMPAESAPAEVESAAEELPAPEAEPLPPEEE
jgi:hypothetical protein